MITIICPKGSRITGFRRAMRISALPAGREAMFSLPDADWIMDADGIQQRKLTKTDLLRASEKSLVARIGAGRAASLVRMMFHPVETVRYYWRAASRRVRQLFHS